MQMVTLFRFLNCLEDLLGVKMIPKDPTISGFIKVSSDKLRLRRAGWIIVLLFYLYIIEIYRLIGIARRINANKLNRIILRKWRIPKLKLPPLPGSPFPRL